MEKAKTGFDVYNTFDELFKDYCRDVEMGVKIPPTYVQLSIDFKQLRIFESKTSYNGGVMQFLFHENVFEIIFTENNRRRNYSYTEYMHDDELEEIISILGNFIHNNIESHIEKGETS